MEIFQDSHRWTSSKRFKKLFMNDLQCDTEQFNDRIIFMSMYNDIVWREQGNIEKCENNSVTVANYARRLPRGRRSFLPGNCTELTLLNQTEIGTKLLNE